MIKLVRTTRLENEVLSKVISAVEHAFVSPYHCTRFVFQSETFLIRYCGDDLYKLYNVKLGDGVPNAYMESFMSESVNEGWGPLMVDLSNAILNYFCGERPCELKNTDWAEWTRLRCIGFTDKEITIRDDILGIIKEMFKDGSYKDPFAYKEYLTDGFHFRMWYDMFYNELIITDIHHCQFDKRASLSGASVDEIGTTFAQAIYKHMNECSENKGASRPYIAFNAIKDILTRTLENNCYESCSEVFGFEKVEYFIHLVGDEIILKDVYGHEVWKIHDLGRKEDITRLADALSDRLIWYVDLKGRVKECVQDTLCDYCHSYLNSTEFGSKFSIKRDYTCTPATLMLFHNNKEICKNANVTENWTVTLERFTNAILDILVNEEEKKEGLPA